jgi:ribonuclease M5
MYNEIIVVEGKNDKARILAVFPNLNVITTNGSEISNETLEMIKELSKTNKIVLFLDPDYPGEKIRSKILSVVPSCDNVFIEKSKAIDVRKHKVGVEHASDEDIKKALQNRISFFEKNDLLTTKDLFELGLIGSELSAVKRSYLSTKLHIGKPNAKTLLNRLNILGLDKKRVGEILNEKNWNC